MCCPSDFAIHTLYRSGEERIDALSTRLVNIEGILQKGISNCESTHSSCTGLVMHVTCISPVSAVACDSRLQCTEHSAPWPHRQSRSS